MSKIYAVDFDGTLCENAYPDIGEPIESVMDYVKQLRADGHTVILWTCRVGDKLTAAVEWCAEQGLVLDGANENTRGNIDFFGGDTRKIYADFYIDDRAMHTREISERGENMKNRSSFFAGKFKTRAEPDGAKYIEGYFAVFNQKTELWPGIYEEIDRAAFDSSLAGNDIRCLYNHNDDIVLGRTGNGTLELKTDAHGLWGTVRINEDDRQAADAYARVARGDIDGCSFGFNPLSERYENLPDGTTLWRVLEADTREVSVCPFPAYPQTEIVARKKDFEANRAKNRDERKKDIKKRLEDMKC